MLTQKQCRDCGAENSVEVDYLRGEVVCNECGIVVEHGLLEDPRTEYREDAPVPGARGLAGVVASTTSGKSQATALDSRSRRAYNAMMSLRTASYVPEAVVEAAQGYFDSFSSIELSEGGRGTDALVLTVACFHVAATLHGYPIPLPEILRSRAVGTRVTEAAAEKARAALISELKLEARWREMAEQRLLHLSRLYARRLQPTLTPRQIDMAACLAQAWIGEVSGLSPVAVVLYSIFLTLYDYPGLADALRETRTVFGLDKAGLPLATDTDRDAAIERVEKAAREPFRGAVAKLMKAQPLSVAVLNAAKALHAKEAAAGTAPEGTASHLAVPSERKRER